MLPHTRFSNRQSTPSSVSDIPSTYSDCCKALHLSTTIEEEKELLSQRPTQHVTSQLVTCEDHLYHSEDTSRRWM